ncbi:single-stranded DNA-binding protein [Glaciihabitans sp. dw_435]|uniref:single-stranded DNA-binding protein n=1 Tax=Glaciihabitans sp. dw_435 TaxID=2720081 RepID=UPI001BD4B30F|nr:single-stranded DNA-binding protein [Glaciihabitans sp. dw_435]
MSDSITITGIVATIPNVIETSQKLSIASFRLASTHRRFDRSTGAWVDGDTNWYTITAFRHLATNIAASLRKGERVIVSGRLKIRDWSAGDKSGTNIEVEAESLGHDLSWGTTTFTRVSRAAAAVAPPASSESGPSTDSEPDEFDDMGASSPERGPDGEATAATAELSHATGGEDSPF